jgi:protein Mpv17
MTVAEGGGSKAVRKKFDGVYMSALKSNYVLWPAVQILNFRVIPLQFQLVGFSAFLRLSANSVIS